MRRKLQQQRIPAIYAAFGIAIAASAFCFGQDSPPETPESPEPPTAEAPTAPPAPSEEAIRAAIADLGSDDFRKREQATRDVWKMGRAAEPFLREAIKGGNFELAYRGKKILEEFEIGIYPDTPENVRRLVNRYRKGDPATRQAAVEELATLGQTELLIRLVKRERDPGLRATVASVIARNVNRLAPQHILEGKLHEAEELLELAALNTRGIRDYAAFLLLTGKLDDAIEKQRERAGDSRVDTELLAWMLRTRGDFDEAAGWFAKVGDSAGERHTRVAAGDIVAYAKNFADPSRRTADTLGFAAAAARLSGDDETAEKILADLEEYGRALPDEADRCLNSLIINGAANRAFKLAGEIAKDELVDMELWRYDFDAAFAALGTDEKTAPYDKWLENFTKDFKVRAKEEVADAIYPAGQFASACMLTGQKAEAERIMRAVARLLEAENASLLPLIRWEVALALNELAREHAVKAMELEIEGDVVRSLYQMRADYAWLTSACWEFIRKHFPDESTDTALRRLGALFEFDDAGNAKGDPLPVLKAIEKTAEKEGNIGEQKELLRMLTDLSRLHEQWTMAPDAMAAWLPLLGVEVASFHHIRFGETLMKAERYAEAAEAFEKAWQLSPTQPSPLYLKGDALVKAGSVDEGEDLKKRAKLMALGDPAKRHFLANAMLTAGETEAAAAQTDLILRLASPQEGVHSIALQRRYLTLNETGDSAATARAMEFFMLTRLLPVNANSLSSRRACLSYLAGLQALQAKAALEKGDTDAAVARLQTMQEINPSDSSMLEDLHQLLLNAGRDADAERFFKTCYAVSKATVERFPNHGQHHNNHAWLLSRCGEKLEEALVHARRAVAMEPENGAFLDTLAEAYFQNGERAKAVAESEKAVALLDGDEQVLRQLERFKNGKPTDR